MRFLLCDPGDYRYRRLFTGTIQLNFACQGRTSYPSATKLVSRASKGNSTPGLSEGAPKMEGEVVVTSLSLGEHPLDPDEVEGIRCSPKDDSVLDSRESTDMQ